MIVEANTAVLSESRGAGGAREEAAPEGRVVGLKHGTNSENFCIMLFFYRPAVGHFVEPGVGGISIEYTEYFSLDAERYNMRVTSVC